MKWSLLIIFNLLVSCSRGIIETAPDSSSIEVKEIIINTTGSEAPEGTRLQFIATAVFIDGSAKDITKETSWSSSDPDVATFSNDVNGRLHTISEGTTELRARYLSQTNSTSFTVYNETPLHVFSPEGSDSLLLNESQEQSILGQFSKGTIFDITDIASSTSSAGVRRTFRKRL